MKRIQLFEFEDFTWFPSWIRTSMTNLIIVLHKMVGTKEVLISLLNDIKKRHNFNQIVDLGSGSGGPMIPTIQAMNEKKEGQPVQLLLTDLHPNATLVQQINDSQLKNINYHSTPVDATDLTNAPKGLKTMVNSFHHIPPKAAKSILKSAQDSREPFFIYEMAENKIPLLAWWLFLPLSLVILILMTLFMTPAVRPLTWKQVVFTYLIPIIPIFYAWDGQASLVRMYTFDDIKMLLSDIETDDYTWEMAPAKKENGKTSGYYVLGLPK